MADGAKKKINPGAPTPGMNEHVVGNPGQGFQIAGSNQPQANTAKSGNIRSPIAGGIHQLPPAQGGGNIFEQPIAQSSKANSSHAHNHQDNNTVARATDGMAAPLSSMIDGLHDKSINFSKSNYIQNKDVMASEDKTRKRVVRLLLMLIFLGILGSYFQFPEVESYVNQKAMHVYETVRIRLPGAEKRPTVVAQPKAEPASAPASGECVRLISNAITTNRTRPLENIERVEIADCNLLSDNLKDAEIYLKPIRKEIEQMTDAEIARAPASKHFGPAFQLLVLAALKRGATNDIDSLLLNRCRTWQRSPSCSAKIYSSALRFYSNSAYEGAKKILSTKSKPIDNYSESILFMGSALAQSWQRNFAAADSNFDSSIKAAGPSLALKRVVFETWAINLHQRGDRERVKSVVKRAHFELASIDNAAKNKLRLIASLNDPSKSQKALQLFLKRQDISYRSRGDVGLLDLIGPESIRTRQTADFLQFVEASRRTVQRQDSATNAVLQGLIVWEVRSLIALGRLAEARQRMQMNKGAVSNSVAGHQLRGSINLSLARNPSDFVSASEDFQAALKMQKNWDSLYGETLSLLRAGRHSLARMNYTRLAQDARSNPERQWLLYLEIEMMLSHNEHAKALEKLKALESVDPRPDSFIRARLMANIHSGLKNVIRSEEYEAKLNSLNKKSNYYSSYDGLTSPMGPLSLMPR